MIMDCSLTFKLDSMSHWCPKFIGHILSCSYVMWFGKK